MASVMASLHWIYKQAVQESGRSIELKAQHLQADAPCMPWLLVSLADVLYAVFFFLIVRL